MTQDYSKLKNLIENSDACEFDEFGHGCSEDWIIKAETRLGVSLAPSYVWWLKNYGGGTVDGQEVFSIYEKDFDTVSGCDVVHMAEINWSKFPEEKNRLYIFEPGSDESYYFLITEKDANGEHPIYRYDYIDNRSELYTKTFADFLYEIISYYES